MVTSRLLLATAARVILLFFAAGLRKSYWNGCTKAATVICQHIFSILALVIFLSKIVLKSVSKSSFFALVSRSGFDLAISDHGAAWILLSFAARLCKSYFLQGGCDSDLSADFSILALVIFLLKILLKNVSKSSVFALGSRSGFGAATSDPVMRSFLCFATQSLQIA